MTPADILRAARALIEQPQHWTQGAYRRDAHGVKCEPEAAVCWCPVGALIHVSPKEPAAFWDALTILNRAVGRDVETWSDAYGRQHADVLQAFDRALALAEAR